MIVSLNVCSLSCLTIPMRLYTFGLKHQHTDHTARPNAHSSALEPAALLSAASIRVLWTAWCDAVIAHSGDDGGGGGQEPRLWDIAYMGTGLTAAQKDFLTSDAHLKRRDSLADALFFGSAMHHGLSGYVVCVTPSSNRDAYAHASSRADQKVVLFGTEVEVEVEVNDDDGVRHVQVFWLTGTHARITHVSIDSAGCVLLYTTTHNASGKCVLRFADVSRFRMYLASGSIDAAEEVILLPYDPHTPPQYAASATTTTAVDDNMRVWTSTRDPRYPRCLGRAYERGADIAPLPYLSESYVARIAAGGYMSAAVSADGELFLWGQTCPGSDKEIGVFTGSAGVEGLVTGVGVDGEQDEFVKCLHVRIHGHEARVYDVGVGHGSVLVAAEVCGTGRETRRVVFAAGDNSRDQLGLGTGADFKERFEEVAALRGKRIVQLAAAGWTTYAVSLEE